MILCDECAASYLLLLLDGTPETNHHVLQAVQEEGDWVRSPLYLYAFNFVIADDRRNGGQAWLCRVERLHWNETVSFLLHAVSLLFCDGK